MKNVVKAPLTASLMYTNSVSLQDIPFWALQGFLSNVSEEVDRLKSKTPYEWDVYINISSDCDGLMPSFKAYAVRNRTEEELSNIEEKRAELKEAEQRVNQLKSELAHYKK